MARILVVDDEERVRIALTLLIDKMGHEVEAYDDAQPAMNSVNLDAIDLVITDLAMPTSGQAPTSTEKCAWR